MKKTLIALLALGGIAMAADEPYYVQLFPDATAVTWAHHYGNMNITQFIDWAADYEVGYYVGGNNNTVGNAPQNGEGTYSLGPNGADITLCGRSGVAGDHFFLVLQDSNMVGKTYSSLTLSLTGASENPFTFGCDFALAVKTDTLVSQVGNISSVKSTDPATATLELAEPFMFTEDTKLIVGFLGGGGDPPTTAYTIHNIQVTAIEAAPPVPEPATGALSLLALAGLCIRRRK